VLVDLLFEPARQFAAAAIGLHPLPEMDVVVVLARIVEERGVLAERALDDLLQGLALEFGPLQQVVAVGHIGLVMLVVVKFQRFLRHMRREGVVGIGKVGEREGHWGHVRKEWDTMANGNLYRRFLGRKKLNSTGPAGAQRVAIANRCAIALNRISHGDEAFMGAEMVKTRFVYAVALLAVSIVMSPVSGRAAGDVIRGKFSVDGIANCENPPIQGFPVHAEGTASLATDRSATV